MPLLANLMGKDNEEMKEKREQKKARIAERRAKQKERRKTRRCAHGNCPKNISED